MLSLQPINNSNTTLSTHINTNHQYPITCVESLDREITTQEVDYVITHLKRNKSPGADNVLNECLIFGKGNLIQLITLIFNILYNTSTFPEQWSEGIVIPIYKKGDTNAHSNYRPITLLSCVSKVFTSILCKQIGLQRIFYFQKLNLGLDQDIAPLTQFLL